MPSALDVKQALLRRYCGADLANPQWVCIEEARSGAGFDGNNRQCDFLAINTFKGRGMELIGHEIKVSMGDWRNELANPDKAEEFARYCRRWFVAAPSSLATKIRDDIPAAWGLLSLSEKGRFTELRKAPARDPEPVPVWWWVGWLAQIDRQTKKRLPYMVDELLRAERARMDAEIDKRVEDRRQYAESQIEMLRANAERLKEATGLDLVRAWPTNVERLGPIWRFVQEGHDFERLATQLRSTADALTGAGG